MLHNKTCIFTLQYISKEKFRIETTFDKQPIILDSK